MNLPERWIWLDDALWPNSQTTGCSGFIKNNNHAVAEFKKTFSFTKAVRSLLLRVSGDTTFRLYANGSLCAAGPVPVGGDFLGNDLPRGQHYASEITLHPGTDTIEFFAQVKLGPVAICEYSQGHGGFMLAGFVTFEDGTQAILSTDSSWLARQNTAYTDSYAYDAAVQLPDFAPAKEVQNIWHARVAPLPQLQEEVLPSPVGELVVPAGETLEFTLEYDRIYAALLGVAARAEGEVLVDITSYELTIDNAARHEHCRFMGNGVYRGFQLHSVGSLLVRVENRSVAPAVITPHVIACCYPVSSCAVTETSDPELNKVLDVCTHTLQYCRQHIHLDSPRHCEPLACTGDYYIESLMTAFSFGDMRLAEFDILRTAELLRGNDGRMFHTTYSLIWVQMLWDIYRFTGHQTLLEECRDALLLLLNRFHTYLGENNLLETPPDYMFIDWLYVDEISLHHPPKALGQTCLNMFYYGALRTAGKIFSVLNDAPMAEQCRTRAATLQNAVNTLLFDKEKQMYFEGLNTPTPEELLYRYMPQNTAKRYYRKHANILAAYVGICEKECAQALLRRVLNDGIDGDVQPYFTHFLLEAVYRCGLREEATLSILERWKAPVRECAKGLAEGFVPPEPTYAFDHSHAWGGTPLYSLPLALLGLRILSPGMAELEITPSLLGLHHARVELPTPFGLLTVAMEDGKAPCISCPPGIALRIN